MCLANCVRAILNQDLHLDDDWESPLCRLGGIDGVTLHVRWRNDAVLPRSITLTPLLSAALFAASDQRIVSAEQLQKVLAEVSQKGGLQIYDNVTLSHSTVGTT